MKLEPKAIERLYMSDTTTIYDKLARTRMLYVNTCKTYLRISTVLFQEINNYALLIEIN